MGRLPQGERGATADLAGAPARGHMGGERDPSKRGPDMTTFDDREKAFEAKYAHDAELQFRVEARRNKLLGLWAAKLMGKSGAAADEYALTVVKSDFEEAGSEDVVRKVVKDLNGAVDAAGVRQMLAELTVVAKNQIQTEGS
jgi:hypothetical protein